MQGNMKMPFAYFIQYVDEEWIPKHAEKYFSARDTKALDYLPKLWIPKEISLMNKMAHYTIQ